MRFPTTDRLVRAFKRGWASTAECFTTKEAQEQYRDTLIGGGILEVLRSIEEFKIPPTTVAGFQTVAIDATDKYGRPVTVMASVFDGMLTTFQTQAQPETHQYDHTEIKWKDGQLRQRVGDGPETNVDERFQTLLSGLEHPENRFGPAGKSYHPVCNCVVEMATFRDPGTQCLHCGKVIASKLASET